MKRKSTNKSILDFMKKKPKEPSLNSEKVTISSSSSLSSVTDQSENSLPSPSSMSSQLSLIAVRDTTSEAISSESEILPDCWNDSQYSDFQKKYDGLTVRDKKLGCNFCSSVISQSLSFKKRGIHVSKEWQYFNEQPSGTTKSIQQSSLRKKMLEHFTSATHKKVLQQGQDKEDDRITDCVDQMNESYIGRTFRVFRTVYNLGKHNRPFSDIEQQVKLQQLNGVDMGVGLHSRQTAANIVEHIGCEIRKVIFDKIVQKNLKISIIIDEASTVACKPVLIVFIKFESSNYSPIAFFDLIELEKQDALSIYTVFLKSLSQAGFTKDYLRNNLIAFCSDGASVMLGCNSGVGTRMQKDFPKIIIWHCLNHRLQLALDDFVSDIKQLNHFKSFMDKLYRLFHQSNKNQIKLSIVAKNLDVEVRKIGRVLGPQWAACSLRSAMAVWKDYPGLVNLFSQDENFRGLLLRLLNINFLKDLSLMIEILQELNLLSTALQARAVTLPKADKLIKRPVKF